MKPISKEIKIGIAAVVAIVALYLLINFMKGINVFKPSNSYYVEFSDVAGLVVSNPVYANGYRVGSVRTIDYDYDHKNRVVVGIELDKDMQVPVGTFAELESSLMGGVSMHLMLGPNPTKHIARGDTIKGQQRQGALAKMEHVIPQVVQMVPKIDSIMSHLNQLTGSQELTTVLKNFAATSTQLHEASVKLNGMMGTQIPSMMANLNVVSKNLHTLSSNAAQVDVNHTMMEVNSALASLQTSLGEMQQFSKNITQISGDIQQKLNSKNNSLGMLLNDRSIYDNLDASARSLNHTLQSADTLLNDLKQNPKRYVHFSVFGKKDK